MTASKSRSTDTRNLITDGSEIIGGLSYLLSTTVRSHRVCKKRSVGEYNVV